MTQQNWYKHAFEYGVIATFLMSLPMILGMLSGIAPMPKPIPMAIIATILGEGLPKPVLLLLGMGSHLVYGGVAAIVLVMLIKRITLWKGVVFGFVLWGIMQVVVLPFLGWGIFGARVTPAIGVATLVLHTIYGASLGWLIERRLSTGRPSDRIAG